MVAEISNKGRGSDGGWFWDNLSRTIGNGQNTLFWGDRWAGEKPLRLVFPRLFHLCENKAVTIGDSGRWEEGKWVWDFKWRRELFERELGASNALLLAISNVSLSAGKDDGWKWKATKDGTYSTKSAYSIMMAARIEPSPLPTAKELLAKVWVTPAPHKAKVIAWRLLRNRLATCDNLLKRNIAMAVEESFCNACVSSVESAEHMFLLCPKAGQVWDEIQKWLGICTARPKGIAQHFNMFTHLGRGKKSGKFLKALWTGTIWLLWKRRNESRFEGKVWEVQSLMLEIKGRLWSWNKIFRIIDLDLSFLLWCSSDPLPL